MLALLAFAISAFFLFFFAIEEELGSLHVLGWGLFFLALGHVLANFDFGRFRDGR